MSENKLAQQVAEYVSSERLHKRLMELARFGGRDDGGVSRETLTELDTQARRYLIDWARSLGCKVYQDGCANLFFRLEGEQDLPPILTGSHIDTQPVGGKYDGAYGVVAGLELIEALRAAGVTPRRPVEVVSWTNEEGSRFAPGAMGSSAYADPSLLPTYLRARDAAGISLSEALEQTLAATCDVPLTRLGGKPDAYIELHIEQGPVLERMGCELGVVSTIQSVRWYSIACSGRMGHAGTTPMDERVDAMVAATELATRIRALAETLFSQGLRFTIGRWQASPNSVNTIAGNVEFTLDVRCVDEQVLSSFEQSLQELIEAYQWAGHIRLGTFFKRGTTHFDPQIVEVVQSACATTCEKLGKPGPVEMTSGAFHDAMYLAEVCPSAMIFVPSRAGISHNANEYTSPEQLYIGARALTHAVAELACA